MCEMWPIKKGIQDPRLQLYFVSRSHMISGTKKSSYNHDQLIETEFYPLKFLWNFRKIFSNVETFLKV